MKPLNLFLAFFVALTWAGCGGFSQGRSAKLRSALLEFNDGLWWGRLDDVIPRVHPDTREHFFEMHREWGREIRLSGYEIIHTDADLEEGKAHVVLRISWYKMSEMEARETEVVQRWEEIDREWMMIAEEYRSGTPF